MRLPLPTLSLSLSRLLQENLSKIVAKRMLRHRRLRRSRSHRQRRRRRRHRDAHAVWHAFAATLTVTSTEAATATTTAPTIEMISLSCQILTSVVIRPVKHFALAVKNRQIREFVEFCREEYFKAVSRVLWIFLATKYNKL